MNSINNIKLICLDLDQTLITHSSWQELGLGLGISYEEDDRLYKEYTEGKFTYKEWNNKVLKQYIQHEHATREGITQILSRYTYTVGARDAVAYMQSKGYVLALISGSIDILVNMVAKELGITYAKANNTFIFDSEERLSSIESADDEVFAKAEYLEDITKILGIDMKECVCIGDGANDREMFRRTGRGVTFKGSVIEHEAWKVIDSFADIRSIL